MARRRQRACVLFAFGCGLGLDARADVTVAVGATANLYRAGGNSPGSSGTDPVGIDLGLDAAGLVVRFVSVTGTTDCDGGAGACPPLGPDGSFTGNISAGPVGTLSRIAYRGEGSLPLLGVFLGPALGHPFLEGLDFRFAEGFALLAADLGQPLWIGDGRTGTGEGALQAFVVPAGATRLFLGYNDSVFVDNTGSSSASFSVPEPSALLLAISAAGALAASARRRRTQVRVRVMRRAR